MVKKDAPRGKNDKSTAAKDTFDLLLVESGQAGTVVLMLDSPEEDVVARAAEAIFRFIEKSSTNTVVLLELDTLPRLLRLIASESRLIRRNTCLVLGSMSKHPNVSKLLKKMDIIPTLIKLLGPDEEAVVNEYAAICLMSLANYYSCIQVICEQNGIEALIRCLSSPDPDVQKNSIEVLSHLLQNFEVKTSVRDLNGFLPVLEMLKSEYAVIQSLALAALRLLSEDAANRSVLSVTSLVAELVNIVANPLFGDIHAQAIVVMANMFLDVETVQTTISSGLMKRLVLIAMDVPPVIEEERKSKGMKDKEKEKESPSKSGKKGKASGKDSADDDFNDKAKSDQVQPVIVASSAEVKEQVAHAIRRAAKNADSRRLLNEQEIEKLLIFLLNHTSEDVQVAASLAVEMMSENLVSRDMFGKLGCIVPLVKLLKDGSNTVQEAAIGALSILTTANEYNSHDVLKNGGVEPLIALVNGENQTMIEQAMTILINMGSEGPLQAKIVRCGVIPALVAVLNFENSVIHNKVAQAISIFVTEACHRKQFVGSAGIAPLILLLSSPNKEVRSNATSAIAVLAADELTADAICHQGALDILRYMQVSDELGNAFVDLAMSKLLNCSLSAKYAVLGKLCPTDIICDGFFDAGALKSGKPLMPLSNYCCEPVNHKRPVLVVNAGLQPSDENEMHDPCDGFAASPPPPRHMKPDNPNLLDLPCDGRLANMIKEVRDILIPLQYTSAAERAIALAQFVSQQMGGPIEVGSLMSFSWELPMSQLKYKFNSNVIPLGEVTAGIHYHRALLYKVIGDRVGIASSLVRGTFNLAWNELALSDEYEDAPIKFPAKTYVIDLIHEPGRLMRTDSAAAVCYCQL